MADREWLMSLGPDLGGAWGGLLRTHQELVARMSEELEHEHGLALTSYDVLRQLALAPDGRLRMRDLAERVMLTRPGLTGVVNRLQADGLVARERAGEDGRGLYARITPPGMRRLREAHSTHDASIRRRFGDHLSTGDLRALRRIWAKLATGNQSPARPSAATLPGDHVLRGGAP